MRLHYFNENGISKADGSSIFDHGAVGNDIVRQYFGQRQF